MQKPQFRDPDSLLTQTEAAAALKGNARTMERWRVTGKGPRFVKLGRKVLYRWSDLRAFLDQQTRRHTADHTPIEPEAA